VEGVAVAQNKLDFEGAKGVKVAKIGEFEAEIDEEAVKKSDFEGMAEKDCVKVGDKVAEGEGVRENPMEVSEGKEEKVLIEESQDEAEEERERKLVKVGIMDVEENREAKAVLEVEVEITLV